MEEKRKKLASIEELEVDTEGNIVVATPEEPTVEEPIADTPVTEPVAEEQATEQATETAEEQAAEEATETQPEEQAEEATEEQAEEQTEEATEEQAEEVAEEQAEESAEDVAEETAATEAEEGVAEAEAFDGEDLAAAAAVATAAAAVGAGVAADGEEKPKYVNKSFAQKMLLADEVIQDRYDEVKNYALRFKKLKARISKKFDSINQGRLQFVKLSVAGKTLKLYLNMDISEVDPKFHCKDMRDKVTYKPVPVMLRIKSGRAVRYAKILIDQCAAKYGLVENKKFKEVDAIKLVEEAVYGKAEAPETEGGQE